MIGAGGGASLRCVTAIGEGTSAGGEWSFAAIVTRTLPPTVWASDPAELVRSESSYSPGAKGWSTAIAHWPFSSALVVATIWPLASTVTSAFGGARPAKTEARSGSMRATSNFELSGVGWARSGRTERDRDADFCFPLWTEGCWENRSNSGSKRTANIVATSRTMLTTRRPMTVLRSIAATPPPLHSRNLSHLAELKDPGLSLEGLFLKRRLVVVVMSGDG